MPATNHAPFLGSAQPPCPLAGSPSHVSGCGTERYDLQRRRANISQAEEFLVHAVKYLFPPELNGETRGVPTAWAAAPLAGELALQNDLPPVWPDPHGRRRGIAITPLHPAVPGLAQRDPDLAERLALVDAIRMGDLRIRNLAAKLLSQRPARPAATA